MLYRLGRLLSRTNHSLLLSPYIGLITGSLTAAGMAATTITYINPTLHDYVSNKLTRNTQQLQDMCETSNYETPKIVDETPQDIKILTRAEKIEQLEERVHECSQMCVDSSRKALDEMSEYSQNLSKILSEYDNIEGLIDNISKLNECSTTVESEIQQAKTIIDTIYKEASELIADNYRQTRKIRQIKSNLRRCENNVENINKLLRTADLKYNEDRQLVKEIIEYANSLIEDIEALSKDELMVYLHRRVVGNNDEKERLKEREELILASMMDDLKRKMDEDIERIVKKTYDSLEKRLASAESTAKSDLRNRIENEIVMAEAKYSKQRIIEDREVLEAQRMEYARQIGFEDRHSSIEDMAEFNVNARKWNKTFKLVTEDIFDLSVEPRAVELWEKCNNVSDLMNRKDYVSREEISELVSELFDCAYKTEFGRSLINCFDDPQIHFEDVCPRGMMMFGCSIFTRKPMSVGILRFLQSLMTFDCSSVTEDSSEKALRNGRMSDARRLMDSPDSRRPVKYLELRQLVDVLRKMSIMSAS